MLVVVRGQDTAEIANFLLAMNKSRHPPTRRTKPLSLPDSHNPNDSAAGRLLGPQHKARSATSSGQRDGGDWNTSTSSVITGSTREPHASSSEDDSDIPNGSQLGSASIGHRIAHESALAHMDWPALRAFDDEDLGPGHSILPRRSHARLPATEKDFQLPFHVKAVPTLDYHYITAHARAGIQHRLRHLWNLLEKFVPLTTAPYSPLREEWATTLLDKKVAEISADASEEGLCSAFAVIEERTAGDRLRFILWPRTVNEYLANEGYKPQVPLPKTPWDVAAADWGAICDLTCSFFQVPLQPKLRHLFRFRDSRGRTLQMRALPMGLSTSPEIMHTLVATIGGDGHFCHPSWRAPHLTVRTWIDNLQWTGARAAVDAFLPTFLKRAERARVTLNSDETCSAASYVFAGITFDHARHTVALGPKAHRHLSTATSLETITCEELERLMGRLWFAARVLAIPLHQYWWALKGARRCMRKLNRAIMSPSDAASLPPSAITQLQLWWNTARLNTPRHILAASESRDHFDVYTDASMKGWGAVSINRDTKSTVILGSRWPIRPLDINSAETRAVALAMERLQTTIPKHSAVHFHIDNTSALAAVRKERARSYAVNAELANVIPLLRGYRVDVAYVASAENLADAPSRQFED